MKADVVETPDSRKAPGAFWGALQVRASELDRIRRLFTAALLVGFALVFFFSASNAVFLDEVGAENLPWAYLANAVLVAAAGFGYSAASRRLRTASLLLWSVRMLGVSIAALWLWNVLVGGPAAAFAAGLWFRFLFIFGLLGLWEVSSEAFDVRQAKRLFPAVALGVMLAFMIGGALVSVVATLVGTTNLLAVSAAFFVAYGFAFERTMDGLNLEGSDDIPPATPRDIVTNRFSLDLALMRTVTILLVFVTEFIFYERVQASFGSDDAIARFLGIFLAGSTLLMVVTTAAVTSRFIARFGIRIGLATMPAGLGLAGLVLGIYGVTVGVDTGFFVLAAIANVCNLVLANAIEVPVGAVMYQPMPVDQRMPVRVAVDGWLGSVGLVIVALLLLLIQAFGAATIVPVVWLLAAVGAAGVLLAQRLYGDYLAALGSATTLAFAGRNSGTLLADVDEGSRAMHAGLVGDDPASAFAIATLVRDLDEHPLRLAVADLIDSDDDDVAELAIRTIGDVGDEAHASRLASLIDDAERSDTLRATALAVAHRLDPLTANQQAAAIAASGTRGPLAAQATALCLAAEPNGAVAAGVARLVASDSASDRRFASRILRACPTDVALGAQIVPGLATLLRDDDEDIVADAISAAHGQVDPLVAGELVSAGRNVAHRRPAIDALATGGTNAIDAVESVIDDLPEEYVIDLVDDVYAVNTRRPPLLHRFLDPAASSGLRRAGFDAVRRADIDLPATITRMVRDDADWARLLIATHRDVATAAPVPALVDTALADEFAAVRQTVWAALRTIGPADRMRELEQVAARGADDDRANTIEALDALLARETRDVVLPILEPAEISEAAEVTTGLPDSLEPTAALQRVREHPRLSQTTRRLFDHHLNASQEPAMSDTLDRVIALKRVDIFSTLPYELLVELAGVVDERSAAVGENVITEGELGEELFALIEGDVEVAGSGAVLSSGTVFGELAVLDPAPRSATVTATSECSMLVLRRSMLLALAERHPTVMSEIARVLAIRLRSTT